jgi:hypothetical protein
MIFDRINAFVRQRYSRDYLRVANWLVQVADSFVGRWFQLEGSDSANEREGSRFLVRTSSITFSRSSLLTSNYSDRNTCRHHNMGACHPYQFVLWLTVFPSGRNGVHRPSLSCFLRSAII